MTLRREAAAGRPQCTTPFRKDLVLLTPGAGEALFPVRPNIDGVAREWARWGRRPQYLMEPGLAEGFARVRRPLLAYSLADDPYAPRPAVEALLDLYTEADIHHRHITPKDVGTGEIGHFGFFRERFRDTLWKDTAAWLASPPQPLQYLNLERHAGEEVVCGIGPSSARVELFPQHLA